MILVSVGTHYLPFDRLLDWINVLLSQKIIKEKIVVQSGSSKAKVYKAKQEAYFDFNEFIGLVKKARIIIAQAGPATIYQSVFYGGKKPVVVPKLKKYKEHVSNHQLYFAKKLARENKILLAENIDELADRIKNYKAGNLMRSFSNVKTLSQKLSKFLEDS